MNDLTEYIKKAFEYKNAADYKSAMDYFYKALAIDNNSIEIMSELASLYSKLCRYDRAVSLYEQILSGNSECSPAKFDFAVLCKKLGNKDKQKELLYELYTLNYNLNNTAEELFSLLLEENKNEEIIQLFKSAKSEIDSDAVFYFVGLAYSGMGCDDLSSEYFRKSFDVKENNIDAGYNLAKSLFEKELYSDSEKLLHHLLKYCEDDRVFALLAEINYINKKTEDAIKYYSLAIKLNSRNAEYFYKLGVLFSLKGFYNEAEQSFCRAVSVEPENIVYNYALAYLYYTNTKYSLSKNLVDYILTLDKENVSAIALKILLLINTGEPALAKSLVEKISQLRDKDDFTWYVQALYYTKLNLWEKALDAVLKAVKQNESSLEYKYELAGIYFKLNKSESALKVCDEILSLNDKYIQAYILKADIALKDGDVDKASANIDIAMKLDINSPEVYSIKGNINMERQNYEEALKNFKTAVSIAPDKEIYYARIAECFYKIGNYCDAYSYYKEAADLNIANAQYRYYMAKCSIMLNEKDNALSNFSVMKRLSPANIDYTEEYALYLLSLGNKNGALKLLKSALNIISITEDKEKVKKIIKKIKKGC